MQIGIGLLYMQSFAYAALKYGHWMKSGLNLGKFFKHKPKE